MSLNLITLCTRRGIKVCQKTVPKDTNQGTDRADNETTEDPPGRAAAKNPNLEMGFVNQAVSTEMGNESEYTRLQRPKLLKLQNPVREIQDYNEYMVPQDQSDEYEEVSKPRRNRSTNDNPYIDSGSLNRYASVYFSLNQGS